MKKTLLVVATVLVSGSTASAGELGAIHKNNKGVKAFMKERTNDAYHQFMDSMVDLPFDPTVHANLGDTFLANKEYDKAINEYKEAIRLAPGQSTRERMVRFHSLFNMAQVHATEKRVEQALETYQKALEILPDSVETKTNMELLIQGGEGGGGEGEQDQKQQDQGQGQDQQKNPNFDDNKDKGKQKQKPKPFDSKDLSQQDVNKILEELKQQEEQVRAKMERQGAKDAPLDKDW